jgi:2-iminoacetate synthase
MWDRDEHTRIARFARRAAAARITMMSAGSHTEPGGYTGEGRDDLHLTVRGRMVKSDACSHDASATEQFQIADDRSPAEIAAMLQQKGFEPVWKDWDQAILAS